MDYAIDYSNVIYYARDFFDNDFNSTYSNSNVLYDTINLVIKLIKNSFNHIKLSISNKFDDEYYILIHDEEIFESEKFGELVIDIKKNYLWKNGLYNVFFASEALNHLSTINFKLYKDKLPLVMNHIPISQYNNSFQTIISNSDDFPEAA